MTNKTFRILSAFAIIFVISGHLKYPGINLFYEWFTPYSFHVPLFLFISGYFYKVDSINTPCRYIIKKAKKLLLPMYLINIVYAVFSQILLNMKGMEFEYSYPINFKSLLVMPLINGHQFSFGYPMWFVFPLFSVEIVNMLFRKTARYLRIDNDWLFSFVYLLIGILGIHEAQIHCGEGVGGLWLLITRTMFLLPIYQFGILYNQKLEQLDTLNNTLYFIILFLTQYILITNNNSLIYLVSWMSGFQNGPIIPYLTTLTGIAFWLRIAKILTPALKNSRIVMTISCHTYSIMAFHILGFFTLNTILFELSKLGLIKGFNVLAYMSFCTYFWDNGHPQFAGLYLLIGVFLPIALSVLFQKIKDLFLTYIILRGCEK